VTIQYERPARARDHDALSYDDTHVLERRQYPSKLCEKGTGASLAEGRVQLQQKRPRSVSRHSAHTQRDHPITVNSNFVSFYFTNVPHDISYFTLRQGFKVCGVMEDLYLAQKRNVNGRVFGFVRYGNVKDVDKLLKAVNNVGFGDWRVVAKVATYDRFGNKKEVGRERGEGVKNSEGDKRKIGGGRGNEGEKINVKEGEKIKDVGYAQVARGVGSGIVATEVEKEGQVLVPKYTSKEQDVLWARRGVWWLLF